jgi:hypothetical protein
MLRILGAALMAALLVACGSPMSGQYARGNGKTLMVSQKVWDGYKEYVGLLQGTNSGEFMVAVLDGVALGYTGRYCPGTRCMVQGNNASKLLNECKGMGEGVECILFARSSDILVDYKLVGS